MNDRDTPLVTALVTFHNQAPFVAPTLDSVLAQTYSKLEVVVVDDGSTDDTRARCLAYGDRIRLVTRPNGGASAARNTGLAIARGTYIAHLDGDDLWHSEKIAVQVDAARRFPEAGMVVVDGHKFRDDGPDEPGLIRGAVGALLATAPEGRTLRPMLRRGHARALRGHSLAVHGAGHRVSRAGALGDAPAIDRRQRDAAADRPPLSDRLRGGRLRRLPLPALEHLGAGGDTRVLLGPRAVSDAPIPPAACRRRPRGRDTGEGAHVRDGAGAGRVLSRPTGWIGPGRGATSSGCSSRAASRYGSGPTWRGWSCPPRW